MRELTDIMQNYQGQWHGPETILTAVHSNVLAQLFFSRDQEIRLAGIVESSPRYSPWGGVRWYTPKGFKWARVEANPVPEIVLARESDHTAALIIDRYMLPCLISDQHLVFTCVDDCVPTVYVADIEVLRHASSVSALKSLANSTYFPSIHRKALVERVPGLPPKLLGHYRFKGEHFVWVLETATGAFTHEPIRWFNKAQKSALESIDCIRVDWASGLLVGGGTKIPKFILSGNGKQLLGFIREYQDGRLDEISVEVIQNWTDRINRTAGDSFSYIY